MENGISLAFISFYSCFILLIQSGAPLLFQIIFKLSKGDFGADSLAAIALLTAVILDQYLVATLIVLMLASGQMLESYAMP